MASFLDSIRRRLLLTRLGDQCAAKMAYLRPEPLAQLLWAFGTAGHRHEALVAAARGRLPRLLPSCSARQLRLLLVAYRRLRLDDPGLLTDMADRLADLQPDAPAQAGGDAEGAIAAPAAAKVAAGAEALGVPSDSDAKRPAKASAEPPGNKCASYLQAEAPRGGISSLRIMVRRPTVRRPPGPLPPSDAL